MNVDYNTRVPNKDSMEKCQFLETEKTIENPYNVRKKSWMPSSSVNFGICFFFVVGLVSLITLLCMVLMMRVQMQQLSADVALLKLKLSENEFLAKIKAFETEDYDEYLSLNPDDEDDEEEEEEDDIEPNFFESDEHSYSDLSKSSDGPSRSRREIPVIADSYEANYRSKPTLSLYEGISENENNQTTENPIKSHHRISAMWPSKHQRHHKKASSEEKHKLPKHVTASPAPIISRPSRVMETDPKKPNSHRLSAKEINSHSRRSAAVHQQRRNNQLERSGEVIDTVYQEQRGSRGAYVRPGMEAEVEFSEFPRRRMAGRTSSSDDRPGTNAGRNRLMAAVHYSGDTSRYSLSHDHYDGNGKLRHPDGEYIDWSPSFWVESLGMDKHFKMDHGTVTITNSGLYYVYSQIHYLDRHDLNGYHVYRNNDEVMLQCNIELRGDYTKSNTCFTSGVFYLQHGDRINVKDLGGMRYTFFQPGRSFFGIVKLGDAKLR